MMTKAGKFASICPLYTLIVGIEGVPILGEVARRRTKTRDARRRTKTQEDARIEEQKTVFSGKDLRLPFE